MISVDVAVEPLHFELRIQIRLIRTDITYKNM